MNNICKKGMFVKVEFFCITSKSKKGFEKGDMHVIITIESTTIVLSILAFQLELIPKKITLNMRDDPLLGLQSNKQKYSGHQIIPCSPNQTF
jgi:hypothetical protein